MDDKTEELRDIFLDVADEETVTESQKELRGSVTESGKSDDDRLATIIDEMREKFTFETDLSESSLQQLVEQFYEGNGDEEIASELSCSENEVFRARMDLHLVREEDPPGASVDETTWERIHDEQDTDATTLAEKLELAESTVERIRAVIESRNRARRVSQRFRTAFEGSLTDADLTNQFAVETHEDGLDDATEDAEVDVEF
jgi:hypothetical protein